MQLGAGSCSRSPRKPPSCPGRLVRLTQDPAASRPNFPQLRLQLATQLGLGGALMWEGPRDGRGRSRFLVPLAPPPHTSGLIKRVARPKRTVGRVGLPAPFSFFGYFLGIGAMTVKTEAARSTLTYSRMRGMVAILIGEFWKGTGLV